METQKEKSNCQVNKDIAIYNIMNNLSETYTKESGVYKRVKNSLKKLTLLEITSLNVMIETSKLHK